MKCDKVLIVAQDFNSMTPEEKNIEMWRIKKLIKTLENAKG